MSSSVRSRTPLSRRKRLWFNVVLVLIPLLVCLAIYAGSVFWRCSNFLRRHQRWEGTVYQSDPTFGYLPRPGAEAVQTLREGDRIPVRIDSDRFRIPESVAPAMDDTNGSILFLGCSFTHGYGVRAEQTFAQLAADALHAKCLNGGVSGWGLAPMVLRARRDIPLFRPQYVVVEHANWLIDRSQALYAPSDFGVVSAPYFYRDAERTQIHPPVFVPVIYDLLQRHRGGSSLFGFVWNVGLRTCVHDDLCMAGTSLYRGAGWLPRPTTSRQEILTSELEELERLCKEHGSRLFIVCLRRSFDDAPLDELNPGRYSIIDPFEALAAALPERSQTAWAKRYYHWRGNPSVLVDMHPSEQAHAIIGKVIAREIRKAEKLTAEPKRQGPKPAK